MIYYRKTLFGSGPKLTAVHVKRVDNKPSVDGGILIIFLNKSIYIVMAHFWIWRLAINTYFQDFKVLCLI